MKRDFDMTLSPEVGQRIADLIGDLIVSKIMCDSKHQEAIETGNSDKFEDAFKAHERWKWWWNDGRRAAVELNELGVPVRIPEEQ